MAHSVDKSEVKWFEDNVFVPMMKEPAMVKLFSKSQPEIEETLKTVFLNMRVEPKRKQHDF